MNGGKFLDHGSNFETEKLNFTLQLTYRTAISFLWSVENEMKINPGKSKAVSVTNRRVKERIRYYFGD